MRIFVAYGYNRRDLWIREMVLPIIEAFGSTVITGDTTYEGPNIPENVRTRIRRSDALIGFTTRRSSTQSNTTWQTHQWVVEELALAFDRGKRTVEVREQGVNLQNGIRQGLQRIEYERRTRDECLVKIVQAVGSWHQTDTVRIKLLPQELINELRPYLNQPGLSCEYIIKSGNYEEDPCVAQIKPITGGLFIDAQDISQDSLIQINIRYGNQRWYSDYESINSYGVHLRQE